VSQKRLQKYFCWAPLTVKLQDSEAIDFQFQSVNDAGSFQQFQLERKHLFLKASCVALLQGSLRNGFHHHLNTTGWESHCTTIHKWSRRHILDMFKLFKAKTFKRLDWQLIAVKKLNFLRVFFWFAKQLRAKFLWAELFYRMIWFEWKWNTL